MQATAVLPACHLHPRGFGAELQLNTHCTQDLEEAPFLVASWNSHRPLNMGPDEGTSCAGSEKWVNGSGLTSLGVPVTFCKSPPKSSLHGAYFLNMGKLQNMAFLTESYVMRMNV